jgi:hypothetical protein
MSAVSASCAASTISTARKDVAADREAAQRLGAVYQTLAATDYDSHAANVLLGRLLFLMFGDHTGMWPDVSGGVLRPALHATRPDGSDVGAGLSRLFTALETPPERRDASVLGLPYLPGGLFTEPLAVPCFDERGRQALLDAAAFDWAKISPAVFGALFETVKSKKDRDAGGEHYTSEANILKVISPLFLDDLAEQVQAAWDDQAALLRLRERLLTLRLFDPACGCGNFLIVAYRELRSVELAVLERLQKLSGRGTGLDEGRRVSLAQVHGLEVEEWPTQIARVALFLVDHQADLEFQERLGTAPPRTGGAAARIVHGNALVVDWATVCPVDDDTVILGNPPYIGGRQESREQKRWQLAVWGSIRGGGAADYAANWFLLAARHMAGTKARAAFVATNSISQGEQPAILWDAISPLGMTIDFAHRTFAWTTDAAGHAQVHVVIIGLSAQSGRSPLPLWDYPTPTATPTRRDAARINPYLIDGPDILIRSSPGTPLAASAQRISVGSQPTDNSLLCKIDQAEADRIRASDPVAAAYLRRFVGGDEMVHNRARYCLWLVNAPAEDLARSPELARRLSAVREFRAASTMSTTRLDAATPHLFQAIRQPDSRYLGLPQHSTDTRPYLPTAFLSPEDVTGNALLTVPGADLFTFGVVSSGLFTAWTATVSGRLGSAYRIMPATTYNCLPWPDRSGPDANAVTRAAQDVLAVREQFPDVSLAHLYDPETMPGEVRAAHRTLDEAVLTLYGLPADAPESVILANLFDRYAALVAMDDNTLF